MLVDSNYHINPHSYEVGKSMARLVNQFSKTKIIAETGPNIVGGHDETVIFLQDMGT
jgi:hypothetical protein